MNGKLTGGACLDVRSWNYFDFSSASFFYTVHASATVYFPLFEVSRVLKNIDIRLMKMLAKDDSMISRKPWKTLKLQQKLIKMQ